MTTTTQEQTTTDADGQQGSHFYVLTIAKALPGGTSADCTLSGHITPPPTWTRADFYQQAYADLIRKYPEMIGASVMYFTVDRNQL